MRLIKHGHACIRIEHDAAVVVVDPGAFTEPEAVEGATAVLMWAKAAFEPEARKVSCPSAARAAPPLIGASR